MFKSREHRFSFSFIRLIAFILVFSIAVSICSCNNAKGSFDGKRFDTTRHITVLVDSYVNFQSQYNVNTSETAKYIHDTVLNELNIDVTFVESQKLNFENGVAPDITLYGNYNVITTYYRMKGVINIAPYLKDNADDLKDLKALLTDDLISPGVEDPQEVWYLTPREFVPNARVTFIRKDWLDKLGLKEPHTREEFYKCITAFRDNADKLLGASSDQMIPFFIDSEPNVSAKPFFDSFLDTAIDDMSLYNHGYCRVAQAGYKDGIKVLNDWYNKGLLPKDFQNIRPDTKEAYEPIEKGFVGAFCAKADYLYANGDNAHINAIRENCGEDAQYIAVNTFEDANGKYNYWNEDYLYESLNKIFIPATCKDPIACLVYLNWISKSENINKISTINNGDSKEDPFTSDRYLITFHGINADIAEGTDAETAINTASEVNYIDKINKCVRYWPTAFEYTHTEENISELYPGSVERFVSNSIACPAAEFESSYKEQFEIYKKCGANTIFKIRYEEWDKVMVHGNLEPW